MNIGFCYLGSAQSLFKLHGKISDFSSGELLPGATVFSESSSIGVATDENGEYSIDLPSGLQTIYIQFIGYESFIFQVNVKKDQRFDFQLKRIKYEIGEIVVNERSPDHALRSTDIGVEHIDVQAIRQLPVLLGERDVLKSIQLLPGISSSAEGSSGLSVRGGSPDQNLMILDDVTVYNPAHLLGFVSVFNSDVIQEMSVYKGGIPAQYGGRIASVIDIGMRHGNPHRFSGSGGIGTISTRLLAEGPILKDKLSFLVSGRRSYMDWLAKTLPIEEINDDITFYFYDFNARLHLQLNEKNQFSLSGYLGKDNFGVDDIGNNWGNKISSLRWNHIVNPSLFINSSVLLSIYDYDFKIGSDASMESGIDDVGLNIKLNYNLNDRHRIQAGGSVLHHSFRPGNFYSNFGGSNVEVTLDKKRAMEYGLFISNNQKVSSRFGIDYGLRFSLFTQLGLDTYVYNYNADNVRTDSIFFEKGARIVQFHDFEPRISANFRVTETFSMKASYNQMSQYLHLLSNSTSDQPTDIWFPSTNNISPQRVQQYSFGLFRNFENHMYETSIEIYYKNIINASDYEDGADILLNADVEAEIQQGDGQSYGLEFLIRKTKGDFSGWVSYTLAKTERKIEGINNNLWYASKFDRTHDLSIVTSYVVSPKIKASLTWVYYTGNAVTFPSGKYSINGVSVAYYTERNGYRMPEYHRLDLGVEVKGKERQRFESSWDFSIYNVYNRKNAYLIEFRESEDYPGTTEAVKYSLFGIIPSVTYNFKF